MRLRVNGEWMAAILTLLAGLVADALVAAPPRPTMEDFWRLEHAADPRVAPDGASVVFVRQRAEIRTDRWLSNLWRVELESGALQPLTSGDHVDRSPRIAPDGHRLAFLSDRSGATQIWLLDLPSGAPRRLTDLTVEPWGLAFSPDGRRLAFLAREPVPPPRPFALPAAPPDAVWAPAPRLIDELGYRADGAGLLKPGTARLWIVDVEGAAAGVARPLTRGVESAASTDWLQGDRDNGAPEWTPDGRFLLISANRRADRAVEPLATEIYEIAVEDGTVRALTDRQGPDAAPTVSPDGRRIAYVGFDDRRLGHQLARLYVMDRDGSNVRCLTEDFDRGVASPRWTPDGRGLLVLYADRGVMKIARVDAASGDRREVAAEVGDGWSTYGGGSFTVGGGGSGLIALTWSPSRVPGDVAVVELAAALGDPSGGLRRLTDLNAEWLGTEDLGEVEEITAASADGASIDAWIVHPPPRVVARDAPAPLILDIHGGPFRDYGPRFDFEKRLWAARGFRVVYANPRGSIGYGQAFVDAIHHAYPGVDRLDLEAVVDAVVERGLADPERLYITGGSGGGLLTLWLISHSHRFRAASSLYPVVLWESQALRTDITGRIVGYWFPGPPWEHLEHYRARSPLWRVGEVETPTLLIAGEEDQRTPISEAELYFSALRHRGVEAVLMRLPGEPHFDEQRPSHALARMLATVGWFERHGGEK